MSAIPLNRILPLGFLLIFSFISLSSCMEFVEDPNNQGGLNLQQRLGNQWAVGHLMGKKSLQDTDFEEMESFAKRNVENMKAESERELRHAQLVVRNILEQYLKNMQN
ncbi:bombesin [Bombina bombina]|uniref:Bombesin n=1 Tax=Bombina variegata TaxID=8348 RepID=BOMB_BOMVA|nr:bombesin [Bombina bombina]P84213.1 RecName: Full=Bombesin; Flags: Precursor [Bombina variegata]CAA36686.1 bombesin [Bombina variegata]